MRYLATAILAHLMVGANSGVLLAAALGVSPPAIYIPPDGSPQVVRVQNRGQQEVLVHVAAVEWSQSYETNQAIGTAEILAVPPIFRIEPHGTQVIRVALRNALQQSREETFRLLITEIPDMLVPVNGVSFAVRLNLPVFVTPEGAAPDPVWIVRDVPNGASELVLRNDGQAHIRVSKLTLQEPGAASPLQKVERGVTALAGEEHRWRVEKPAHGWPQVLQVRAQTQHGELVWPLNHARE